MTTTRTITLPDVGAVDLQFTERGDDGDPYLVLHGGAGPLSVAGFADRLADQQRARVITPTHPGFAGTVRPDGLRTPGKLAELYAGLLEDLDLAGVTVVGNSVGGWITAEMAIPGARFELLPGTGHLPQVETPELLVSKISGFVDNLADKPSQPRQ